MRIASYNEFWPFYVRQHAHPVCRALHFLGTSLALAMVVLAFTVDPRFGLAAPVSGYFFAWIGHFVFERNKPATFTYPLWSLRADFRMYWLTLTLRMGREVRKALDAAPASV